jgi:hypothetical protein
MSNDGDKQEKTKDDLFIFRYIFLPFRVRCTVQNNNGIDAFLLDYGFNFLPIVGIISWVLFFIR